MLREPIPLLLVMAEWRSFLGDKEALSLS